MADNFDGILAVARQIGEAIRQHPRYVDLKEADARVRANKAATDALEAYNKAAGDLGPEGTGRASPSRWPRSTTSSG